MPARGGPGSPWSVVTLIVAGVALVALLIVFAVPFVLQGLQGATAGDDDAVIRELRVSRAEARALVDADEAAGDALGFLLMAAHDGDETALAEARAYAAPSVSDATLVTWIAAARQAVTSDPSEVDAQVLRSRLETDGGRDLATCEVAARVGEQVVRARVVLTREVVTTAAGELDQWGVVELGFGDGD